MRTLYLLRHAKSTWKDESLPDFERPLSGRGKKACQAMAKVIETMEVEPDLTVSSTAVRARETIELVRQFAKMRSELRYDERIYEAPTSRLMDVLRDIESDRKSALLVGHNPGFEDLLYSLTGAHEPFPTAALAKIKLKVSKWSDALPNKGTVEWIVRPKEIEED